jgi:hypothetical protein
VGGVGSCSGTEPFPKDLPYEAADVADVMPCCVVLPRPVGATYDMGTTETVITGRKVIVGNPVAMPLLDGKAAPRIFRVVAGAFR